VADLSDIVAQLAQRIRRSVRVGVSALVQTYDAASQSARVAPSVVEAEAGAAPAVGGVPVLWPGGATRGITMGLAADDGVVLVVRHRSHDEVDAGTGALPASPVAGRTMSYADAVALPGYVPPADGRPSGQYRSDGQIVVYLGSGESVYIGSSTAAQALARADRTDAQLGQIRDVLTTWVVVPGDGGAALKAAMLAALASSPPVSVASSRVRVDA